MTPDVEKRLTAELTTRIKTYEEGKLTRHYPEQWEAFGYIHGLLQTLYTMAGEAPFYDTLSQLWNDEWLRIDKAFKAGQEVPNAL